MRRVLLVLSVVLGILLGLLAYRLRSALPSPYSITRAARYSSASLEETWALAAQPETWAEWRSDLRGVTRQPDVRKHEVWQETWGDGQVVTLETAEEIVNRRQIRCVVDQGGAIGGCWTLEASPREPGCVLSITEAVTIHSTWFKIRYNELSRKAALDTFLSLLGAKLGEPEPRLGSSMPEVSRPL